MMNRTQRTVIPETRAISRGIDVLMAFSGQMLMHRLHDWQEGRHLGRFRPLSGAVFRASRGTPLRARPVIRIACTGQVRAQMPQPVQSESAA